MAKVKIKLNHAAVGELLKLTILPELEERAYAIAVAAGLGMEVETSIGRTRARAEVRTATWEAIVAEAKSRSLTRAIDAGRYEA